MGETFSFVDPGPEQLFTVLHDAQAEPHRSPFVFCHPFGEEKLWAHRAYVTFARALAQRGHPVLRLDFRGNGDSSGEFAASSLSTMLQDVDRAIDTVKQRTGAASVNLLGLRFGATLAALAADRREDVASLVLWAPVVNGGRYMQDLLRINLTTQMAVYREIRFDRPALVEQMRSGRTVNVDGYELSLRMFDEVSAVDISAGTHAFAGRVYITQIERAASAKSSPDLERLRASYARGEFALVQEEPFWKEIDRFYDSAPHLLASTLAWIE